MEIKGFPGYTVNKHGIVYHHGKKLTPYDNGQGYKQVKLWKDGKRYTKNIHRLVLGEPLEGDVDHKDKNKGNNSKENLRNITHQENVKRAFK